MTTIRRALTGLLAAALLTTGCAAEPDGADAGADATMPSDQTVVVEMVDIAFEPVTVTVKAGQSVRFVFRNEGALPHQAYVGDEAIQQELARGKGEPVGVEVKAGQTKSFVQTFEQPGRTLIGCHIPGHYQAGMKARLIIE